MAYMTENKDGKRSTMRLMCFLSFCTAATLAIWKCAATFLNHGSIDDQLILYFLVAAIGGKAGQKVTEVWRSSPKV